MAFSQLRFNNWRQRIDPRIFLFARISSQRPWFRFRNATIWLGILFTSCRRQLKYFLFFFILGDPVDDVQLPPWSLGKPRLFIQIHRQALESSWVRDHLHHWIDLIFGFKQTTPSAIESLLKFFIRPPIYAGLDTVLQKDRMTIRLKGVRTSLWFDHMLVRCLANSSVISRTLRASNLLKLNC